MRLLKIICIYIALGVVFLNSCKKNDRLIDSGTNPSTKQTESVRNKTESLQSGVPLYVNAIYSMGPIGGSLSIITNDPDAYLWTDPISYTYTLDGNVIATITSTSYSIATSLSVGTHTVKVTNDKGGEGQYSFNISQDGSTTQVDNNQGPFLYSVFGYISHITNNMPHVRVQWNYSILQYDPLEKDIYIEVIAARAGGGSGPVFSKTVPLSVGYLDINLMGPDSPQIQYGDKIVISAYNKNGKVGVPKTYYSDCEYGTVINDHPLVEYFRMGGHGTTQLGSFYDSSIYYNEIVN